MGVVGNTERFETTVIGDAVNVAARIQDLTKSLGAELLISETTHLNLDDPGAYSTRFIDRIQVKGRLRPVSVYEVFDSDPEELESSKVIGLDLFEDGVASYHSGYSDEAREIFERYANIAPSDKCLNTYLERSSADTAYQPKYVKASRAEEFVWQSAYDTGNDLIDHQHHHLVEIYDHLRQAVSEGEPPTIEKVLADLKDYSVGHFSAEAELMRKSRYPLMAEHLHEHRHFVNRLDHLSSAIRGSKRRTRTIIFWINVFLFDWLATHSSKIDRHLTKFIAHSG